MCSKFVENWDLLWVLCKLDSFFWMFHIISMRRLWISRQNIVSCSVTVADVAMKQRNHYCKVLHVQHMLLAAHTWTELQVPSFLPTKTTEKEDSIGSRSPQHTRPSLLFTRWSCGLDSINPETERHLVNFHRCSGLNSHHFHIIR